MNKERKAKYQAAALSVLLHLLVFLVVASTGIFSNSPVREKLIDLVVYEEAAASPAASASTGTGSSEMASNNISLPSPQTLPAVTKEYTRAKPVPEAAGENPKQGEAVSKGNPENRGADTGSVNGKETAAKKGGSGTGDSGAGAGGAAGTAGSATGQLNRPPKISPPQPVPVYPENLHRRNIEGAVTVRIIVGADGLVENVEILQSSGYDEMDAAATEAVYQYRYQPAVSSNGDEVRCAITRTLHFAIE
ncbi:MAG: energy transducer TonB [Selenomonadaceae bacterium]